MRHPRSADGWAIGRGQHEADGTDRLRPAPDHCRTDGLRRHESAAALGSIQGGSADRFELSKFGVIISEEDSSQIYDFAYFFNRWRKDRDIVTLVVEMPRSEERRVGKECRSR